MGKSKVYDTKIDMQKISKIDPSKAGKEEKSELSWYDGKDLNIEGKAWKDTEGYYERIPLRMKGKATPNVWDLSKNTAGICVKFITDSSKIGAAWDGGTAMNHMAATGNSGLDLYVKTDSGWKYCATGRPNTTRTVSVIKSRENKELHEYMLYLPLYNKVTELKIGIDADSFIAPALDRPKSKSKPIVFYGTSITQGGCASRAGMCHPAILGRWLDREVINLGFSGSGRMEPELAELYSELDPAIYILECLPNMTTDMVKERLEPFYAKLRQTHPKTPILLVENPLLSSSSEQNIALQKIFNKIVKQGDKNVYYLKSKPQLDGIENGTVDGVHPTDLGFFRMANAYYPLLNKILKE